MDSSANNNNHTIHATHLYFTARTDSDFYPLWDGKISVSFETKQ